MRVKSIKRSLVVLCVLTASIVALIVAAIGIFYLKSSTDMAYNDYKTAMNDGYKKEIKSQVESAVTAINGFYNRYQNGELSLEQAQYEAKETVRTMRYRDDQSGYMWIDATDYTLIMHPILPQNEGNNRYTLKDQNGVMIIQEIMKSVQNGEGGYNSFYFTKADGVTVAQKLAYSEKFEPWNWVITTGNYTDDMDAEMVDVSNSITNQFRYMLIFIVISVMILIVITIITSYIFGSKMIKPILLMQNMANRIASGNISEPTKLKEKNEIGKMSEALNQAQENVKELVLGISDAAGKISQSLEQFGGSFSQMQTSISEVSCAMDDISQNITDQADSTKSASQDVEEIGAEIGQTNTEVQLLDQNSQEMSKLSDQSLETIKNLIQISEKTKLQINEMQEQTSMTNNSVQRIQSAANVINDIAEQTDLLALNASIEAARAGEAGKGFSVVAEQIGVLARQSADNVVAIGDVVAELLDNSEKSLSIMENVISQMNTQYDCINNTQKDFENLHSGLDQCMKSIHIIDEMTNNIEKQRRNVTDTLLKLNSIAQDNAASTQETTAMATELASLVQASDQLIQYMKNGTEQLTKGVGQFKI